MRVRVSLRPGMPSDAARVCEVLLESRKAFLPFAPSAHPEPDVLRWVGEVLLPGSDVTVAEEGGSIVGVIATSARNDGTWIEQLYLHPTHVGHGVGSRLLAHALATAPRPVRLYTFQQNEGSRRFYERHGFVPIAFSDGAGNEERCPDVLYELAREMPPRLKLEAPSIERAASYRAHVQEFVDRGEPLVPFVLEFPTDPPSDLISRLEGCARGEGIPPGFVPHSTFWLVLDDNEVVGVSNLRHRLTEKLEVEGGHIGYGIRPSRRGRGFATVILRETLRRARALGILDALVTCAKTNLASVNTIVRNGGRLVSEEFIASRGEVVQRYRIAVVGPVSNGGSK